MQSVVGIFQSKPSVAEAVQRLRGIPIPQDRINILVPGTPIGEAQLESILVTDTEQPGVAEALGAVVGGASGAAAWLAVPLLLPGVGTITAIGMGAAAILAAASAIGGAVAGAALESALDDGIPVDELYVYRDALRQGRVVVVVETTCDAEASQVHTIFAAVGAESVDAAHDQWWTGLRSAEDAHYRASGGGDFDADEAHYRRGFEAAQLLATRNKAYPEALPYLRIHYSDVCDHAAFRRGYERGQRHREIILL